MLSIDVVSGFPAAPGVYLMRDVAGTILYVGKARDLRKRVRSYFRATRDGRLQIPFLMERVAGIDYLVTDTEKEALLLENTLIKEHRPRYNFNLRDDKTYFSLRLDPHEEFPRLTVIRKVVRDGTRYFGPYSSAAAAREVLKQLQRIFPLRHYPLETCRRRPRPCLFHQLRQCSAPCHGLISREEYALLVTGAMLFLEGKNRDLVKVFQQRMAAAAAAERFEEAARLRDQIRAIELTVEKQKMVTTGGDADVVGYHRRGSQLEVALLFIRGGRLIGSRTFPLTWELDDTEGITSFLDEYYQQEVYVPEEVLLPLPLPEANGLVEFLAEKRGRRVRLNYPQRGGRAELVALAAKNARIAAVERQTGAEGVTTTLRELQEHLHLQRLPRLIECYDISTIQGRHAVGSKVACRDGLAAKQLYRRYRIRNVAQADDFGMMREVLARRFKLDGKDAELPDLIVVDGGIGQLNVLVGVLTELGLTGLDTVALAKSRVTREMASDEIDRSAERVFLPGRKNPVVLRQNSAPLLLLARLRDEAHRFAITYHQRLRGRETIASALGDIPGIGEKRRKELLRRFGSLRAIRAATVEQLQSVGGLPGAVALTVHAHLHGNEKGDEP
jgi:excinuclease ABC subunit C